MRILVCTERLKYPLTEGSSLKIFNTFKILSRKHEVYLFFLKKSAENLRAAEKFVRLGVFKDFSYLEPPSGFNQIINPHSRALNRMFPKFQRIAERAVKRVVAERHVDVLHVHLHPMGLLLANLSAIPRALDLTDSSILYTLRMFFPLRSPIPLRFLLHSYYLIRAAWNERYLLRKYNTVTVVSPIGRDYLRKLSRDATIHVIQLGVTIENSSPSTVDEEHPSIIFFGHMGFLPNIDAVLYLAHEILPLIKLKFPRTKLYIVGASPSKEILKLGTLEDVVVTGFVDDITEYISKASVALLPMRKGGGQKFKILEAMALRKPVVTTPIGAESFCQSMKEVLLIGRNPSELAEKTVKLLINQDLREDLGGRGFEVVRTRYNWRVCAEEHERMYEKILESWNR